MGQFFFWLVYEQVETLQPILSIFTLFWAFKLIASLDDSLAE